MRRLPQNPKLEKSPLKGNVRTKATKFERRKGGKDVKSITKVSSNKMPSRPCSKPSEDVKEEMVEEEDPFKAFMAKFRGRLDRIEAKLKTNSTKVDKVQGKVVAIE